MISTAFPQRTERLVDASVVTAVVDIAGARHEVLPPRRHVAGGLSVQPTLRVAPP
ncbi:hypothetical protein R8Z57_14570 [Microbacterium sp. M3]|uniref:Uncharacterized protein n=1 Tax=Microbacterium arthrosphaerae TaxID=792652 RepID=A0ABU4H3U0_9MICO|nr:MULTISPECIES: hypothetical protein [Microbacterium]MDW4574002.1 hypothetical protein [Microbacterium arthrosphaerae]MDW7607857.1 hypothetical protein [Microbacterium sp. M3]